MLRRAVVTGGLGFIGSRLARRLRADGAQVAVIDNLAPDGGGRPFHAADGAEIVVADARDAETMARLVDGADAVFHLAARTSHAGSMGDPRGDLAGNADATLNVLEACRQRNPLARVVYASTRQVYGRATQPASEALPPDPLDCNGVSKLAGEGYCRVYSRVHGVRCVSLRFTNTYGPGMRIVDARQMFLGIWIRRAIEGGALQVFGDGRQRRDLLHVDDAVDALLLAAAAEDPAPVYNVGGPADVPLMDIARSLAKAAGGLRIEQVPFPDDRRPIDIGDWQSDSSLIRAQLGWAPRLDLEQGLVATLAYYRDNFGRYVP